MFTFLFTDLEASTRLWEQHPQEMGPALARHDEILRQAVIDHGGELVKTTGDGLMASFGSPSECVDACLQAQRALIGTDWGIPEPLRVRMGVHVGEAQPRAGDYYGTAVNRAARIMAAAHGGQVLFSALAVQLAGLAAGRGVGMRDLGRHRLKDLQQPEHLFQLTHPDLPAEFPPLATLESTPNTLPVQVSEFVGRAVEMEAVRSMLQAPGTRLITLTGPGGTGKTRLALQAAAESLETFPDGVYFVDLAGDREPDAAFETVLGVLGFAGTREGSSLQMLKVRLAEGRRLLVLDNLEQVTDAGAGVVELLGACPDLEVMVTSREALRVRGEHLFPVPTLSLPDLRDSSAFEDSEAVQLFLDRARAAQPGFALDDDSARAVAEIAVGLDGLPLALELAAARLELFGVMGLRDRLRTRADVLGKGARDLPDRQRTLRSTIEWSYELLDPEECRMFELLSVFSSARLEAIEAVAEEANPDLDVFESLGSLVSKSLVVGVDDGGSRRFSMLRAIREYAAERLAANPDTAEAVRLAHARYHARRVAAARPDLDGPGRGSALAALLEEIEDLRTAWQFWAARNDIEQLRLMVDGMWALIDARGWYHTAVELTSDLLAALETEPPSTDRDTEEMTLRASLARSLMAVRGFSAEVESHFRSALDLSASSDPATRAPVLRALASYYMNVADFPAATALGRELLALGERQQNPAVMVEGHIVIGATVFPEGLQDGLDHLEQAIALFDPATHGSGRFRAGASPGVVARNASALLLADRGFPERAHVRATEALDLATSLGHPFSVAYSLYHLGYLELVRSRFESTLQRAHSLATVAADNDYTVWRALASVLQGVALCGLGHGEDGLALAARGTELYQGLTTPPVFWAPLQAVRALGFHLAGRPRPALELIEDVIGLLGPAPIYPGFRVLHGDILHTMTGDPAVAGASYRTALDMAVEVGSRLTELTARCRLLRLAEPADRSPGDLEALRVLYEGFTEGFDEPELVDARSLLESD